MIDLKKTAVVYYLKSALKQTRHVLAILDGKKVECGTEVGFLTLLRVFTSAGMQSVHFVDLHREWTGCEAERHYAEMTGKAKPNEQGFRCQQCPQAGDVCKETLQLKPAKG